MTDFTTIKQGRCWRCQNPCAGNTPACPHCGYTEAQANADRFADTQRQQQMANFADMIANREDQNARRRWSEIWGVPHDWLKRLVIAAVIGIAFMGAVALFNLIYYISHVP